MRPPWAFVTALIAIAALIPTPASSESRKRKIGKQQIVQNRDLRQYDDGGDFSLVAFRDHGKIPNVAALRGFIWSHWQQKKRGYVRLALSGVDNTNTSHIFIEPGEDGRWHIAWRELGEQALIPPPPDRLSDRPEIISLERSKHKKDDWPGGEYVLVFRAKGGKEVGRL